jgi:hypothetical protein
MLITCHKDRLRDRCNERGYTIEEVMPCVIAQQGDMWTIETDSIAYPKYRKLASSAAALYGHNRDLAIYVCDD